MSDHSSYGLDVFLEGGKEDAFVANGGRTESLSTEPLATLAATGDADAFVANVKQQQAKQTAKLDPGNKPRYLTFRPAACHITC